MELQALRTFQTVVEEGGIISASKKLNTVQSNVTSRIKRLEEELGSDLFYRKGRGLELSPSGKVLLEYARQLIHLEQQAGTAVREAGETTGELRIGSMESFAAFRLPATLKRLRQSYETLALHVETDTSAALIARVLNFKLDCAFVGGPVEHPDLVAREVLTEELVLVRQKGTAEEVQPLMLFREGCVYRARALTWRLENGAQVSDIMELGTLDGILGCVAMGLGCTLMPRWVAQTSRYAKDLETTPVAPRIGEVATLLIRHRSSAPMKALDALAHAATA